MGKPVEDIVTRLRQTRVCMLPNEWEDRELADEAADEIERLWGLLKSPSLGFSDDEIRYSKPMRTINLASERTG